MHYKEICKLYYEFEERYRNVSFYHLKDKDFSTLDYDNDFSMYVLYDDEDNSCIKTLPDIGINAHAKFHSKVAQLLLKLKL